MWLYKRLFISLIACGLLFGCGFFIRLQLSDRALLHRTPPEFLPNVARYRTSRVCSGRAVVLVNSSPYKAQRRQLIRETWAHPTVIQSLDVSVAFAVGAAEKSDVQRLVDWEAEIYGDVFQDFALETENGAFRSAPKIMRLLKAARSACAPAPVFVMKTEDDVFLNAYALADLLESLETYASSNTMWCLEWNRKLDKLGQNISWIVLRTTQSIEGEHPAYCIADSYLMTLRALDGLVRRHEFQTSTGGDTLLPESVYITGVLTKEARLTLSLLGERFSLNDPNEVDAGKMFLAHLGDRFENDTQKLWRNLLEEKLHNGNRRSKVGL